jgi:ectoine hydroxylase-related dioxygenase (phytanoyl-CoA dioxygenase family)
MLFEIHEFNQGFDWKPVEGPFRRVTAEQARKFNDDGFFVLEGALSEEEVARLTAAIDPIEAQEERILIEKHGGKKLIARAHEITFTVQLALRVPAVRELVTGPVFRDVCGDLIGPDVRLYWDMSVYKKPGTTAPFPWHQDNGYTFVDPQQYLTCWVALGPATVDNGCLWALPGAHKRGTYVHRATSVGLSCLRGDPDGKVPIELAPGSIAIMSSLTPHWTGPNVSNGVRKGLVCEFIPDGAVSVRKTETGALERIPLRGAQNMWVLRGGEIPAPRAATAGA